MGLINSGDTDGRVPVLSTRYSLSSLNLPILRPWRPWYNQKQVMFCRSNLFITKAFIMSYAYKKNRE